MNQEQLNEVLRLHKLWLENKPEGKIADLFGTDLSRADLFEANLSGADLSLANLSGANLSGANLSGANLSGANLSGVNLFRANLSNTILEGKTIITFQYKKHLAYFFGLNEITIGCHKFSIDHWLKNFKEIGTKEDYSKEEIKKYGNFIKQCAKIYKKENI